MKLLSTSHPAPRPRPFSAVDASAAAHHLLGVEPRQPPHQVPTAAARARPSSAAATGGGLRSWNTDNGRCVPYEFVTIKLCCSGSLKRDVLTGSACSTAAPTRSQHLDLPQPKSSNSLHLQRQPRLHGRGLVRLTATCLQERLQSRRVCHADRCLKVVICIEASRHQIHHRMLNCLQVKTNSRLYMTTWWEWLEPRARALRDLGTNCRRGLMLRICLLEGATMCQSLW